MKTLAASTLALFIFGGATVQAKDFRYTCYTYLVNGERGEKSTLELVVNEASASGVLKNEDGEIIEKMNSIKNMNHKSKGEVSYVKFGELIVEESILSGGRLMKDGKLGGLVRFEGQADGGFFQYKFVCKSN